MKKYKGYKVSGVEWIGEVPSHWDIAPLKRTLTLNNGCDYKHIISDDGYPVLGSGGQFAYASDYLYDGEVLLLGRKGTIDRPLYFKGKFWTVDTMFYGVPKDNADAKYLYYQAITFPFDYYATATALPSMKGSDLENNPICLPPLAEQKAIAEYLDEKCGKIDGMIEQIDKKVALYERLRRAIIAKTVTKGLDPNVPLRPSGIEWIGEIPMHWDVKRFGYLAWIRARLGWKGLKADEYVESGYPFLSAFNIVNDKMNWESLNYINQFRFEESPEIMLHPGDILLVKDGAGIGKCARVDSLPKGESTTNGSLAVITPFEAVNYKYLHYFIISDSFNQYKDILINGMGVPHLTQGEMKKMYLPVPPIKEQEEIAEYLDKRCHVIEENIANYVKQKELLERYRKALIAQVVTGKRRVCEPSFIYPDVTSDSPAMAAE